MYVSCAGAAALNGSISSLRCRNSRSSLNNNGASWTCPISRSSRPAVVTVMTKAAGSRLAALLPAGKQDRTRTRYLRCSNIILCRNGRHRGSHDERRVRGAQCEGAFVREWRCRCCLKTSRSWAKVSLLTERWVAVVRWRRSCGRCEVRRQRSRCGRLIMKARDWS